MRRGLAFRVLVPACSGEWAQRMLMRFVSVGFIGSMSFAALTAPVATRCGDDGPVGTGGMDGGPPRAGCGNGKVDGFEECDGSDLGRASTCHDLNPNDGDGKLKCGNDCRYDVSECTRCGDGRQ